MISSLIEGDACLPYVQYCLELVWKGIILDGDGVSQDGFDLAQNESNLCRFNSRTLSGSRDLTKITEGFVFLDRIGLGLFCD